MKQNGSEKIIENRENRTDYEYPDVCAPAFGVVEIDLAVGVHAVFFNRAVKETVFS